MMSVSLQKGQKVDLTKGNSGLTKIIVGLGWDEAKPANKGKGLFGGLFSGGSNQQNIDCDASAIICGPGGKLANTKDVVYFANLNHESGGVHHLGDNLTGAGDGDDEQITVDFTKVPAKYEKIVFVVNIYDAVQRHQHFGLIENAFIRIVDASNNKELCKYNLSDNYENMTAMVFGEVYRQQSEWKFSAVGSATTDKNLGEIAARFQ